jgi:hypothetical protein
VTCEDCGCDPIDCPTCGESLCGCNESDHEHDRDDEPHHARGPMHEASDEAMDRWARAYDELNGAPESEEDR